MVHRFHKDISQIALPQKFTYPFHYTPHPLCVMAVEEVQAYLASQLTWKAELDGGKMFGVLVVKDDNGAMGYLAAFSGNLAGSNKHPFFVPPVYDLLQPGGFFKEEEAKISAINAEIYLLQNDDGYRSVKKELNILETESGNYIKQEKERLKQAKEIREKRRAENPSQQEMERMVKESQYQKAELKRKERQIKDKVTALKSNISVFENKIEELKRERKNRSAALQLKLFDQFQLLNARGEVRGLCSIFESTAQRVPPAGAGECAAPKLLQHAYLNHLQPIAMAEFWWGESPKTEIRRHGHYYPACKSKCEPILRHMLQGLEVDGNPLAVDVHRNTELEVVYEDAYLLVVNKPAGMQSVPGKLAVDTVYGRVKALYPEATGPLVVHRLDMATSGLLLIAKSKEVHKALQSQFANRTIKKRYVAVLDGLVVENQGRIELPLCLNPHDRPRQMVDMEHGKPAVTFFRVLERTRNRTKIAFFPQTGRTHQLRVHASHPLGLNAPIVGDELYGQKSDRLYLHAESIEFTHPITGERVIVEKKAGF